MNRRPIRILQLVGGMNRGGIETWLMHLLRRLDPARFKIDIMVHTDQPCPYDDEVRASGSRVLPCLHPGRPWEYAGNFRRVVAASGPYDIIHSHVHHYSGYVLRLARKAGIPVRIAHSHNVPSPRDLAPDLRRRLYLALSTRWIQRYATCGLAVSEAAAAALFGLQWKSDPRWRVLYCGIDVSPFRLPADPSVRSALDIPPGAFVIGHIGRFAEQKNHRFLIEIAHAVSCLEPRSILLLIGDGPLRPAIERRVAELGLSGRVIFAGLQSDVPRVLAGAVDVLVMPSLHEGLPLVGLEAQAAGVPCVLSDIITPEMDVLPPLIRRLSLSDSAEIWADAVLASWRKAPHVGRAEALKAIEKSPFAIEESIRQLQEVYAGTSEENAKTLKP